MRPRSLLAAAVVVAVACTTDTSVGPDTIASLAVSPDSTDVIVGTTRQLTAVVHDANGVPFVGVPTAWASGNPGIATVSATGLVSGVAFGTTTISATVESLTATAKITVVPPPSIALSATTVTFTAVAGGPDPAPQTVAVTNGGGSSLVGLAVDTVIYSGGSGWLTASLDVPSAPATLTLIAATGSLAVGSYTATVRLASPVAANSPQDITVTFTVSVGAPTQMTVSAGNGQVATVNTAVTPPPAVLVRDQYGNPVPGVSVTFAVTGGGGSVSGGTQVTGANGIATVGSWILGTTAGPNTLDATASGLPTLTFTATGTAGAATQVSASAGDGQSATVSTAVTTPPAVLVRDQFNNPVAGVAVTFAVASGGGSLTGGNLTSNASGIATVGSWTLGTTAGTNTLAATATGLAGSPVTFTATGTPDVAVSLSRVGGDAQTDTVGATLVIPYTVKASDQYGNGVSGVTVTWAVTGGGSITPSSITSASGIATATRVLGTTAGSQGATATVGGLTGSPVGFTATATHGTATQFVKFAGDAQSATVDSTVGIPPAARVLDQFGNPVPGVAVTFAVASGGGTVTPTTPISTNASGVAAVTSWRLGSVAGANSLTAAAAGFATLTFTATAISGAAQNLVLVSGDAQTDTIDATLLPYVVRVTDVNGNGVQGVGVSWQVTGGGGTITLNSTTDANGDAAATRVLGTVAGPASAQASVGGLTGSPRTFTATVLPGNADVLSKNAGDGQSATVGTAVATAPQAKVTDRAGNVVSGVNVTFTVASGGGSTAPLSPATLGTDGSGLATLSSWTLGTVAGANTLAVTAGGLTGSPATFSATGTPDVPSAAQSTVAAGAATVTACATSCTVAGGTADSVTVTVRDQYGNSVGAGISVTVSATGTSNTFTPGATGTTNTSGVFATKLSSTKAEAKTVSATAGVTGITQTAGVTVNPDPAGLIANSTVAASTPITASSGGSVSTVTVTVRDQFLNPFVGRTVSIAVSPATGNTVTQPAGTTNASGVATGSFYTTRAETKTVTASVSGMGGGTLTGNALVTVNPAAASQVVMVTQPANWTSGTTSGSTQPSVRLQDPFGNNVSQSLVSITASVNSGTGTLSGTVSASTNASGIATYTNLSITGQLTGTGNHRLQFASAGLTTALSNTFTVLTSFSYNLQFIFANNGCNGCHGGFTWAILVNQQSSNCPGETYVIPFNAAGSFLQQKVDYTQACGSGMPTSGIMPLSTRDIIRSWINQGALDN